MTTVRREGRSWAEAKKRKHFVRSEQCKSSSLELGGQPLLQAWNDFRRCEVSSVHVKMWVHVCVCGNMSVCICM